MNTDTDILIIGGGVTGASIFYHLVSNGYQVTLFEKSTIASGCTNASGGIVRCFHLDSSWCDKSVYGAHYYRTFKKHTGQELDISPCGFVFIPHPDNLHRARLQVQKLAQNTPINWLHQSEIAMQFPTIFKTIPTYLVYEPDAFYTSPIEVTKAWMNAGTISGGEFYEFTEVKSIYPKQGYVEIMTLSGKITAKNVVIAAGSHTPGLLDQLRYTHSLFKKKISLDVRMLPESAASHPAFIEEKTGLYGRGDVASGLFYIGLPTNNTLSSFTHSETIYQHGINSFSGIENSILHATKESEDCYSQDGSGCVMALNEDKTIYLASGFSGGGFKIAPWIGYETARLIKQKESIGIIQ